MVDFIRYRVPSAIFSAALLALFIGLAAYRKSTHGGVFSYSIDFTGGTQVLFKLDKRVPAQQLKNILESKGWHGAVIREFSNNELLVRVKEFSNDAKGLAERIRHEITQEIPDANAQILQSEGVGPGVGATLRWKSFRAVIYALIAMLAYIALRFWSPSFAIGAVIALFHDAFVMLLAFLLLNREISVNVIGAILAVLGYSINDTIVIFSEIRDNLAKMRTASLAEVVNVSLNKMMRRTLLTSISTGLAVLAMLILGGEALADFSIALMVGIIFGTYSSVYIASPIMMLLYKREE